MRHPVVVAEEVVVDPLLGLVLAAQRAQASGDHKAARRATGALFIAIMPTLKRSAAKLTVIGDCTREELVQVAATMALRRLPTYDATRGTFIAWLRVNVNRELTEYVQVHGATVSMGSHASRGRTKASKEESEVRISVVSTDAPQRHAEGEDCDAAISRKLPNMSSTQSSDLGADEQLLEHEQRTALRRAVFKLPAQQRDLVCLAYGIDCEAVSVREMAIRMKLPRSGIARVLKEAEIALRAVLGAK